MSQLVSTLQTELISATVSQLTLGQPTILRVRVSLLVGPRLETPQNSVHYCRRSVIGYQHIPNLDSACQVGPWPQKHPGRNSGAMEQQPTVRQSPLHQSEVAGESADWKHYPTTRGLQERNAWRQESNGGGEMNVRVVGSTAMSSTSL